MEGHRTDNLCYLKGPQVVVPHILVSTVGNYVSNGGDLVHMPLEKLYLRSDTYKKTS